MRRRDVPRRIEQGSNELDVEGDRVPRRVRAPIENSEGGAVVECLGHERGRAAWRNLLSRHDPPVTERREAKPGIDASPIDRRLSLRKGSGLGAEELLCGDD